MQTLVTRPSLGQTLSTLTLAAVGGFAPYLLLIAALWFEIDTLPTVAYIFMGILFVVWCLSVVSILFVPFPSTRRRAIRISTAAVGITPAIIFSGALVGTVESRQLNQSIANGQIIADAIIRYATDHGAPPTELKNLIPRYLNKLPESPRRLRILSDEHTPDRYEGNAWVLFSEANALMSRESGYYLVYFPNKNYPQPIYRKIGEWAVHNPS